MLLAVGEDSMLLVVGEDSVYAAKKLPMSFSCDVSFLLSLFWGDGEVGGWGSFCRPFKK